MYVGEDLAGITRNRKTAFRRLSEDMSDWIPRASWNFYFRFVHPLRSSTCRSPAVRTALHVLRSLKLPSVALHVVECTFQRGFDSFRAHHLLSITYDDFQKAGDAYLVSWSGIVQHSDLISHQQDTPEAVRNVCHEFSRGQLI